MFKKSYSTLMVLAGLVLLVYFNSLNGAFVSDDKLTLPFILANGLGKSLISRPYSVFQTVIMYFSYKIGGGSPIPFHLINIISHIAVVWMVFFVIDEIGRLNNRPYTNIAFFTATLFAVHPILTESVTWISGGPYVRYALFVLLTFLFYVKSKNKKWYWLSFVTFVTALLFSEDALVLPLILAVYELSFGSIKKNWKKLVPYFAISALWSLLYITQIGTRMAAVSGQSYQPSSTLNPLVQIPVAITSYLQLIFWPDKLTLYHSDLSLGLVDYWIRVIATFGVIGIIIWGWKKNKYIFFWLSFFIISLLPMLTPLGISWIVAERYVYLGSIGIIGLIGYMLNGLTKNKKTETVGYLIFVMVILGLMIRTFVRNIDWQTEDNLWIATGNTSPSYWVTHNNLGDVYGRHGDLKRSAEEFELAIKLNRRYADAYHNLGNTLRQMGDTANALKNFQLALKYNPGLWQSDENIAAIYFSQGNFSSAADFMQRAIKISPNDTNLYAGLGEIYLKANDKNKAKQAFLKALSIDSGNANAKAGLAAAE